MYNRVLNCQDLVSFREELESKNYPKDFPHVDLWSKDDAVLKWMSVLKEVKCIRRKNLKVVDLGSGSGCTPHIIASWGHDVTAIDITNISHFCPNSLVKMVLNDVLIEIKEMEEQTVDVFTDVCAVTHFNNNVKDGFGNIGWKNVADQVYRVLKPKGKFIVSTDVNVSSVFGEFISPEEIIKTVQSSGLKLKGKYNKDSEQTDFHISYDGTKLQVACLIFEK